MDEMTSIVIVDDHPIVIQGLKNLLETEPAYYVKAQFTSGKGLLAFLKDNTTDIILLDVTLPDGNGIHFCRQVCHDFPGIMVIAISNLSERSIVKQMLESGAKGYLLKTADPKDILHCIQAALHGTVAFSNEVKRLMEVPELGDQVEVPELTKREKQILQLLSEGKSSAEIAALLFISPLTVKTHRATLFQKFNAHNPIHLVNLARQYGLL